MPDSPSSSVLWQQRDSWRLRRRLRTRADGRTLENVFVEHPGSVTLVPLRPQAQGYEVLMVRQYRIALDEEIVELPAGTRHWGEAWLDCAQRELREETGFRAGSLTALGQIWPAPGLTDELMTLYLARELAADPLPADEDEMIELEPVLLTTLVAMAREGGLQDAKSVVAIWRTVSHLDQQGIDWRGRDDV